ncbi:DUF2243 domain-containing protein [Allohahella marinimesophila]|uniref:DUF2243 domain-containing protein n=1 Tax=Allohahella marinimesophila TaxID=1054972 RepID=A0ABP7NJL3_9GAMM
MHDDNQPENAARRSLWSAALIGVGIMAAVDEIIFHQLLGWHHFYDGSTPVIGLMSDGFLHAAELIALVAGFFLLLDARRHRALMSSYVWAGFFFGAGAFQVFDGIIDHKVLRLHQIRYEVENLLIYDLAWNAVGLLLILIGWMIFRRGKNNTHVPNRATRS